MVRASVLSALGFMRSTVVSALGLFADVLVDFLNIETHLAELADHLRQFSSDLRDDAVHVFEIGLSLLLGRGTLGTVLVGSGAGKCSLVRLEEGLAFGERDAGQTFSHTVDIDLQDSQLTTQLGDLLLHLLEGSAYMVESSATDSAMESSMVSEMTTVMTASTTAAFVKHALVIQMFEQMTTLETLADQTKTTTLFSGTSATEMVALGERRVIQRIDDWSHQAFNGSVQVVGQVLGIVKTTNTSATHVLRQNRMNMHDAMNDHTFRFTILVDNIVMNDVIVVVVVVVTANTHAAMITRTTVLVASTSNTITDPVDLVFELVRSSVQVVNLDLRHRGDSRSKS